MRATEEAAAQCETRRRSTDKGHGRGLLLLLEEANRRFTATEGDRVVLRIWIGFF